MNLFKSLNIVAKNKLKLKIIKLNPVYLLKKMINIKILKHNFQHKNKSHSYK